MLHKWMFSPTHFQYFFISTVIFLRKTLKDIHIGPLVEFGLLSTFPEIYSFPGSPMGFSLVSTTNWK